MGKNDEPTKTNGLRWRRLVPAVISTAAGFIAISGSAHVTSLVDSVNPDSSMPVSNEVVTPPGMRFVGLRHAAIAVPLEWGTNRLGCGVPVADTVVIDDPVIELCGMRVLDNVESVWISPGPPGLGFEVDERTEIGGVPAERQSTTCDPVRGGQTLVCRGVIYIPSEQVTFAARSTTSRADVDRILEWIRIVPDKVGVPGFGSINVYEQGGAQTKYVDALKEAGLNAEIRTQKGYAIDPGYILDVSPAPGTLVVPGQVVAVTVVAEPEGPGDEVSVQIVSVDATEEGEYRTLDDVQLRSGATIEINVGDRMWAYARGKRASTLAAQLDGSSLVVGEEGSPNYPHIWTAISQGNTKITLTITADGEPVVLGVVTVVVH